MVDPLYRLGAELFPPQPSKKQKRMVQMIEATIRCYSTLGIENTSYDQIAKLCGVTPPLVHTYFKSKEKLFAMVVQYIRIHLQGLAVQALSAEPNASRQFDAYILSTFAWLEKFPRHAHVWHLFLYRCGFDRKMLKLNTEYVNQGHARIAALLERGAVEGAFEVSDFAASAREVQVYLTGALSSAGTEDLDPELFKKQTLAVCRRLARAKQQ